MWGAEVGSLAWFLSAVCTAVALVMFLNAMQE